MNDYFRRYFKYTVAFAVLLAASFLFGVKVLPAEPTLLHLDFQDQQGRKVEVMKATLVLVVGNYVDKLPLKFSGEGLDLPLDASWLRSHWPGGASRLKNVDRAYVFLTAPGYALVCSGPIQWLGTESSGLGKNVVISFPRGKTLVVSKGQKLSTTVEFRRPTERFLKVSGTQGKPLIGVHVRSYVFWSKSDNGDLNGADLLNEGSTDATGRVPVVDGDFTYAFQIDYKAAPGKKAGTVLVVKRFADKEYPAVLKDDPSTDTP